METKTIAQLWEEMQEHLTSLNLERMIGRSADGSTLNNFADHAKVRIPALRAELSERCKSVKDVHGDAVKFRLLINNGLCEVSTPGILDFVGSPNELRELSAACAFSAWHLEELQKEKKDQRVESHC